MVILSNRRPQNTISGRRFSFLSLADWQRLQRKGALVFNICTNSLNQFRVYALEELLKIISIFESLISIKAKPEIMSPFHVIENGRELLLRREAAIKLNVLRLGVNVNRVDEIKPFTKWKDVVD